MSIQVKPDIPRVYPLGSLSVLIFVSGITASEEKPIVFPAPHLAPHRDGDAGWKQEYFSFKWVSESGWTFQLLD